MRRRLTVSDRGEKASVAPPNSRTIKAACRASTSRTRPAIAAPADRSQAPTAWPRLVAQRQVCRVPVHGSRRSQMVRTSYPAPYGFGNEPRS